MKIAILLSTCSLLTPLLAESQFSAEVEYLLFQAHQDGFFRATDIYLPPQASGVAVANEKDYCMEDNRWNSGVRASFGWEPDNRPWTLSAQYTYLGGKIPSKNLTGTFTGDTEAFENTLIFSDYLTNTVSVAADYSNQGSWKFSFNQIDLTIDQPFCIGEGTTLTPYFGLRGLCLRQTVDISALNVIPNGVDTGLPSIHRIVIEPRLEGIGLIGGLEGRFTLGYGFDLWGRFGGGLVWGRFKTLQNQSVTLVDNTPIGYETMDRTFWGTSLNGNLGLGIEWSCPFNCGSQWMTVTFGWENHLYTKTNHAENFFLEEFSIGSRALTLDRNIQRGDFSLQGFSLGATYLF